MAIDRETYFKALQDMMATPGWKILSEEMSTAVEVAKDTALQAPDWGSVQYCKGRISAFQEFLTLESNIAQQLEPDEDNSDADL